MTNEQWIQIIPLALAVLGAALGALGLLLRLTWQASKILTRLDALEASGVAREAQMEAAHRAVGCIEQLEEGYERVRARLLEHEDQISSLRVGRRHEMNGAE